MNEPTRAAEMAVQERPAVDRYAGAKGWMIEFDADSPAATVRASGNALNVNATEDTAEVSVALPFSRHVLVRAQRDMATLFSGPAFLPVYCRMRGRTVSLSNVAYNLVLQGEEVGISTFVLVQQLLGTNYPMDDLFTDIKLLEYSASYVADRNGLKYLSSVLRHLPHITTDDVMKDLYRQLNSMFSAGRPAAVLLSGGYDSRLNLALARKYQRKAGFPISLWHEFKDDKELAIAQAVADKVDLPLTIKDRASFAADAGELECNDAYVRFHSGTYRDNLPRWHQYLDFIRQAEPRSLIVGLGAEAHKGKYYDQVKTLADLRKAFGADRLKIRFLAKRLKLPLDDDIEDKFFEELVSHSEVYPDMTSRIDFIHYHTYVCNGYGRRCHDVSQFFSVPFPFLCESFLSKVFSLPPEKKKDFRIVKDALDELAHDLVDIPFTSGNARALGAKDAGLLSRALPVQDFARLLRMQFAPAVRKGGGTTFVRDKAVLATTGSAKNTSGLTSVLSSVLSAEIDLPYLRFDYVAQMLRYAKLLEREKGVSFRCQ